MIKTPVVHLVAIAALAFGLGACELLDSLGGGPNVEDDVGGGGRGDAGLSDVGLSDTGTGTGDAGTGVTDTGAGTGDTGTGTDLGLDTGTGDTGTGDDTGEDPGPPVCAWTQPAAGTAKRAVLVGHSYSSEEADPGTELSLFWMGADRTITDPRETLDLGFRVSRIQVVPSGEFALVLGEEGDLATVSIGSDLDVLDTVRLGSADYGDIRLYPELGMAFIVGMNSAATGGVTSIQINCAGEMTVLTDAFFPLRLARSMDWVGPGRAVILGGQAVFEPADTRDLRLIEWQKTGWVELGAFDIFGDSVIAGRIAATPDGSQVLVPNNAMFSEEAGLVLAAAVSGETISEGYRLPDLEDPEEALVSLDGETALVTLMEPGRVVVFKKNTAGQFAEMRRITGIGLATQMSRVERGSLADTILIPSIDTSGMSNIAILSIDGPGSVTDHGQFNLGNGIRAIPSSVGVAP